MFSNIFDEAVGDMLRTLSVFSNTPKLSSDMMLENKGLRGIIKKPHDLYTIKDKDGNITSYGLSIVYTPFKKSDVKVLIENGSLSVQCGTENHVDENSENMVYHGISSQSYSFSFPLDESIDTDKVTAKAEDGILKIELPVKEVIPEAKEVKQIEVM